MNHACAALVADFGLGDDTVVSARLNAAGLDALLLRRPLGALVQVLDARDLSLPPTLAELRFNCLLDFTDEGLVAQVPSWRAVAQYRAELLARRAADGAPTAGEAALDVMIADAERKLSSVLQAALRQPPLEGLCRSWRVARWLAEHTLVVVVHARAGSADPKSLVARAIEMGAHDVLLEAPFYPDGDAGRGAWGIAAATFGARVWFTWTKRDVLAAWERADVLRLAPRAIAPGAPSALTEDDVEVDRLITAIDARVSAQVREILRHPRLVALESVCRVR